ncbi:MAG: hypothetical protein JW781_02850 [Deltaproteobacteria bacterium]|nr:hypothetical protein [Candidatus Anaeroferrophillacea bacterium]
MYTVGAPDKNGANIFALLGDERATESPAPAVYHQLLDLAGLTGSYTAFPVIPGNLEAVIHGLGALNIRAANIDVPLQETIIPHLFALSEGAKIIGSVNAILRHGLYYKGYNTNALGLMDALQGVGCNAGSCKSVLVFGAGGAARAAVFLFRWLGVPDVTIAARRLEQAQEVANHLGGAKPVSLDSLAGQSLSAQVIINATPVSVGEENHEAIIDLVRSLDFRDRGIVVDFNAAVRDSAWQELAGRLGVPFMRGETILVHQARHTLALWCGVQLPPETEKKISWPRV